MTNNNLRGQEGRSAPDGANPRADNRWGHIIEATEADNDPSGTSFTWSIFLLAGENTNESTYFAGYPREQVSSMGAPDNITFDVADNLWIAGRPAQRHQGERRHLSGADRWSATRLPASVYVWRAGRGDGQPGVQY